MSGLKLYEQYMKIIGPVGNMMFFLQAYEIFSRHNSSVISVPGFTLSLVANTSWLIYGILVKNQPLIISGVVAVIGAASVLMGVIIYPAQ